jgi:phenylpyruvate tautomerase PptA (4-oxalocrotonate tautomerase family)
VPLVHIHVIDGRRTPDELRHLCDVVQGVMRRDFAAPENDRYQLVTAHPAGSIIVEDSGLGFTRTNDVIVIEITHQGRTREQKIAMYHAMAQALSESTGLNPNDLIISLTENHREDWSFGAGAAQFLDGMLD